jgi:uncharacterized protein YcgI (DUF1989 family)
MKDLALPRAEYPFPRAHYEALVAGRARFTTVSDHLLEASGHGFRVEAGQAFRFTLATGPQVLDVCMMSADDPHEHLFPGTQMAIEGGRISRFTRLWGTPPKSRPLATCIADSVRGTPSPRGTGEHFPHGAHCNPHLWQLYAGKHSRPCYDNLRYALAMLGLNQRHIHDNLNLFMKGGYDAVTGASIADESDATTGDYLEFYAETALFVAISLCPAEAGSDDLRESWTEEAGGTIAVNPVRVTILDTGIAPLGWPVAGTAAAR